MTARKWDKGGQAGTSGATPAGALICNQPSHMDDQELLLGLS